MNTFNWIVLLLIVGRTLCSLKLQLSNDTFLIFFWFLLEMTFIGLPFFRNYDHYGRFDNQAILNVLNLGNISTLAFLTTSLILKSFLNPGKIREHNLILNTFKFDQITIATLSIFAFGMTYIAYSLKVGIAGIPNPNLPYKLDSIINITKNIILPSLFVVIGYRILSSDLKKKLPYKVLLLLISSWFIAETLTKNTRGLVILALFKIVFLATKGQQIKWRHLLLTSSLLLLLFIPTYRVITNLRLYSYDVNANKYESKAQYLLRGIYERRNIDEMFFRFFGSGFEILKFKEYFDKNNVNNALDQVIEMKGGGHFHTYIIDKIPKTAPHSSGITALGDGFLFLSSSGIYLTVILITILIFLLENYSIPIISNHLFTTVTSGCLLVGTLYGGEGFWSLLFRSPFYWLSILSLFLVLNFYIYSTQILNYVLKKLRKVNIQ